MAGTQREDVLGVVGDAGRVAVPPFGEDLVAVGLLPVAELELRGVDAGFLEHFAARRVDQRFVAFLGCR